MNLEKKYVCINCGEPIDELFKKYALTVLKLTTCDNCNKTADKYVEYDLMIIIIDLILLNKEAYRHVLLNTGYMIHWKLYIILELMEAYFEWSLTHRVTYKRQIGNKEPILFDNFFTGDLEYYKTFLNVTIKNLFFIMVICILTYLYNYFYKKRSTFTAVVLQMWKCITLSSFGFFLLLPSLVWAQYSMLRYHYLFVSLYTILSQLVAYTEICECGKWWSIIVIILACGSKLMFFDYYFPLSIK